METIIYILCVLIIFIVITNILKRFGMYD